MVAGADLPDHHDPGVALPMAFVFNLFLDRFIADFTMGAVKG